MSLKKFLNYALDGFYERPRISPLTELINAEAELGRTIFGPIPEGHQREFFEHKKNVWIWYESWLNQKGNPESITVRYEVKPEGVYKIYPGGQYTRLKGDELENFRRAAHMYLDLIKTKLYF